MKKILFLILISVALFNLQAKKAKKVTTAKTVESTDLLKNIPSPGKKNLVLATFVNGKDSVKIKEFDVFGTPTLYSYPEMLNKQERDAKIRSYLFYKQLCIEGENGDAVKSLDYENMFNSAVKREAAIYLQDYLIVPRVITEDSINIYFKANSPKFPAGPIKERQKLLESLKKRHEKQIGKLAEKWLDSVSVEYGMEYNDELFKRVTGFNFITPAALADSLNAFSTYELSTALIICSKIENRVTLSGLVKILKEIPPQYLASFKNITKLKNLINGPILNQILTLEANKFKLTENPLVIEKTKESLKPALGSIQEKILFIDGNFIPTKNEMIKYFNDNNQTDKDLWCKRKMDVMEVFKTFDDSDKDSSNHKIRVAIEMENILESIKKGEEIDKFARLYHRKMSQYGHLNWIFREDHGLVGETAFTMKPNEVSELIYHPKGISIIKVIRTNEARPYAFEYVEEIIKQKLITAKKEAARKKMQSDLNKKYKVKFFI